MFVIDLLKQIDLNVIAAMQADNDWELNNDQSISDIEREAIRKEYVKILSERYKKILEIKPEYNENKIIVVVKQYESINNEYYYDAAVYDRHELLEKQLNDRSVYKKNEDLTMEEYEKRYIQSQAFELTDWKYILGYEVSKESISEYGMEIVANAIIDEMTFFGSEYESNNQKREETIDELEKSLDEIKNGTYNSIPLNLDEMCKEFDLPIETEEEKEKRHREMLDELERNRLERNRILKKLIKHLKERN